ncbi:Uncharacterized protein PECH_000601 [Penicillium ucsense]|uniref:Uncharacterized protein n=1 Tax=Penicillium ucsense TaxID=2839758 RepID=A0A8J8W0B6_9EURO|nr:Uncharacterized protein PECM_000574 [Penicillium ucsense]KAF7733443.1 Uncharacterized protein PECH_000601 [Penicillium ucsense]
MQVAEILSDITSLRACGHTEALALVTVASEDTRAEKNQSVTASHQDSKFGALQRAKELVSLHYEVKSRHANGEVDHELQQAREAVERVLRELS